MCCCKNGLPGEAGQVRRQSLVLDTLVLGARRQYGCLYHEALSSYEQFLAVPDPCQYSPNTVWDGKTRRKQEISRVCLHHKKQQNAPVRRKNYFSFSGEKLI